MEVRQQLFAREQHRQALQTLVLQDADFIAEVLLQAGHLAGFDRLGALVFLGPFPREDLHVDHDAFDAGRAGQRRVSNVTGLFAEDSSQQLLLRRQLRFTFRRHFADQDVSRLDVGADADNAAFVQVPEQGFRHVGDVARDLFRPQLRVPGLNLKLFNMDGSVGVFLHQLLAHQDGVLKVVAPPGHESHQDVAAQGQLAVVGAGPVSQNHARGHALAPAHQWLLVDARVLVRAPEFDELINVGADLARKLPAVAVSLDAHNDALAVNAVDHAVPFRHHHSARIASRDLFHSRTHQRRLSPQQRN